MTCSCIANLHAIMLRDPALEGKAVDKLPMVETGTGQAPRAAPDLHRGRLSPGARRNLTDQTIEMLLGLPPGADCFRLRPQGPDVDHDPSPRFASQ